MPNFNSTKNKHMTFEDRQEIMECLDKGMTFKAIARKIMKDATTVSKEVKKRLELQPISVKLSKADGTAINDKRCPLLLKAPFVCNSCKKRRGVGCPYQKQLYIAKKAQAEYESLLK